MPSLEERAWLRYERQLLRKVDAVVTFTERDRRSMLELDPHTRVEVISPGVRLSDPALDPQGHGPPAILFCGNYLHPPNVDAALRLAGDIYPRLVQVLPNLVLWLPGERPPEELQRLASERIVVPGRVESLKPYMDAAAIVVTPLRIGGGMRVKVIEALAAGKALVASKLAVAGLDLKDGEQYALAESDDEFAAASLRLLTNPGERAALATRARVWAAANLTWQRAAAQYVALHEDLLAQRRGLPERES